MPVVTVSHRGPAKGYDIMREITKADPALMFSNLEGMSVRLTSHNLRTTLEPLPAYPPKTGQEDRTQHFHNADNHVVLTVKHSPQGGRVYVQPVGDELVDENLVFEVFGRLRQAN